MKTLLTFNLKPKLILVLVAATLAGCTVIPQKATQEEVANRVKEDVSKMYVNQEPITAPITLEIAVARTLKYNLDYRLKQMESALALGIADYSKYDMWPKLLANAGYNARSNYSGGTSVGIEDGLESLRPSTSQERDSILQATLIAAATSQLTTMKAWLVQADSSKLNLSKS